MAAARPVVRRLWSGFLAAGPGLALLALYGLRLISLRNDPSGSPGTPGETIIALMVAAFAAASFVLARAAFDGRLPRFIKRIGVISLAAGVCGLCFGVVVMA
jgi:hypothetical protein